MNAGLRPALDGVGRATLADWCTSFSGLYLYYPGRRQVPAPLQAFIAFARKALSRPSENMLAFDRLAGVPQRKTPR